VIDRSFSPLPFRLFTDFPVTHMRPAHVAPPLLPSPYHKTTRDQTLGDELKSTSPNRGPTKSLLQSNLTQPKNKKPQKTKLWCCFSNTPPNYIFQKASPRFFPYGSDPLPFCSLLRSRALRGCVSGWYVRRPKKRLVFPARHQTAPSSSIFASFFPR